MKDEQFRAIRSTLDNECRRVYARGVGSGTKNTPAISDEEEEKPWETCDSPLALLRAVFYLNGKNFCLRVGEEHRSLTPSQLIREPPDTSKTVVSYTYIERGSKNNKNNPGGLSHLRAENKRVTQDALPQLGDKCHCRLLDLYRARLPTDIRPDAFNFLPLPKVHSSPSAPWFHAKRVMVKNTLATMVRDMRQEAGIGGKTNHSLRVTGATRLFAGGISEKLVKRRTGHLSLEALIVYERPSKEQLETASAVISGGVPLKVMSDVCTSDVAEEGKRDPSTSDRSGKKSGDSSSSSTGPSFTFNFFCK